MSAALEDDVSAWIVSLLAAKLAIPTDEVDTLVAFADYGVDSGAALELVAALRARFGINMVVTALWDYPNVETLSAYVASACTKEWRPETNAPSQLDVKV